LLNMCLAERELAFVAMLHRLKISFRRGLLVMLVGAVFLSACASDEEAENSGSTTEAVAEVSSPNSSEAEEPENTEDTETSTDSTEAGDDPSDGTEGGEIESRDEVMLVIEKALNDGHLAFLEVIAEPVGTDLNDLTRWFDPDRSVVIGEFVASIQEAGLAVRRGDLALEQIVVESVELVSPELAEVVYCLSTDSVVYDVTNDDVVDDSVGAFRYSTNMLFDGGTWKDGVQDLLEFFVGPECLTSS